MRIERLALLLAFALSCGAVAEARDLVHLKNGNVLEGDVIQESADMVVLRLSRGTTRIPRSDVYMIERGQELPAWALERRRQLIDAMKRRQELLQQTQLQEAAKKSTGPSERIKNLIEDLGAEDEETRRQARDALSAAGREAIPALTAALAQQSAFRREGAAGLLGELNARASVKAMLVALRSAVPEKARIPPWQRRFVRVLRDSLRKITGRNFGLSDRRAAQAKTIAKWVEWWEGASPEGAGAEAVPKGAYATWDTPQVGEPEFDPDDPEHEKKLWEARRLGSEKHAYRPPPGFLKGILDTGR